jgi:hypothetical protein
MTLSVQHCPPALMNRKLLTQQNLNASSIRFKHNNVATVKDGHLKNLLADWT